MRVLIAEDEAFNQIVIRDMMMILFPRVQIDIVSNGAEALERMRTERYDLLLSDVDMPVMNGYELVKSVKETGDAPPMICVTAYAVSGDREKLLMHGFDDYISKPIDMSQMQRVLARFIL